MAKPPVKLADDEMNAAIRLLAKYQKDPVKYCNEIFGTVMWSKQREILESVRDNFATTVRSCHASGKTYIAANTALWWLGCHPPAIVVSTAPTGHQVKDLLWAEINTLYAKAKVPFGGECLTTRLNIAPDWYAVGLSTREPQMFQGFHSPNILIIVDEANGVDDTIFEAIDGILSTANDDYADIGNVRLLMIGNPIVPMGKFYESHIKDVREAYHKIHISAFDTPGFTDEDIPPRIAAHLTSPKWAKEREAEWGLESPLYLSKVLGEFPSEEQDVIIAPMAWLMAAQLNAMNHSGPLPLGDFIQIGVDVARFGSSRSIFTWRSANVVMGFEEHFHKGIDELGRALYALCARLIAEFKLPIKVAIDAGGVGGGLVDTFRPPRGVSYGGVNFGQVSSEPLKFMFLRAQMYWMFRTSLEKQKILWVPADDETMQGRCAQRAISQFAQIRYHYDSRGRIVLESKEDMRERGVPSPDDADSVVLSFCPMTAQVKQRRRVGEKSII